MSTQPNCPLISPSEKVFVLCEKPSVARDLGAILGAKPDAGGYLPFEGGTISWAFGHLMEQLAPHDYREDWKSWNWESLPMVPPDFVFRSGVRSGADARVLKQLDTLCKLYRDADVVVNACDAGREGELIWWTILRHCGWGATKAPGVPGDKKGLRFWAQSNTPAGMREAWEAMKSVNDRLGLAESAYSRSEGDWLLGMNLSRAATMCFPPPTVGEKKTVWSIGRVQTPVLALIANRDMEIRNFTAKPFFEVRLGFECSSPFEATLLVPSDIEPFIPEGSSPKEPKGFLKRDDAMNAVSRVMGTKPNPWVITDEEKAGAENAPVLFSLTDLQKWCNQTWGWEAARTLTAAQAAYETDKSLSYPRTDACFLPVDSKAKMDDVYQAVRKKYLDGSVDLPSWSVDPSISSRAGFLFDDSKLTDHYAIVPTGLIPGDLTSDAGKVWLAVLRRFIVAFGPAAKTVTVKRRCVSGNDVAVASGKRYEDRGWLDADDLLAPMVGLEAKGTPAGLGAVPDTIPVDSARLHEGKTTAPKALTESSLLSLMENIHTKLDSDEQELKEALAGKGLGTPATRAATIELLITRAYIQRVKKGGGAPSILATESGHSLINNLRESGLDSLTQPDMTAEWESNLTEMERGRSTGMRIPFLQGLLKEVENGVTVLRARASSATSVGMRPRKDLDVCCPFTGTPVGDFGTYWSFAGFGRIQKSIAGRVFTVDEIISVLTGTAPVFEGFISKKNRAFAASMKADMEAKKLDFVFQESADVTEAGTCPMTGKPILDYGGYWMFPERPDKFWKTMAKRTMSLDDYCQIVEEGKTTMLEGFISAQGKPFSASLIFKDGKVSFDFPPRTGAPAPGGGKPKASGKSGGGVAKGPGKKKK